MWGVVRRFTSTPLRCPYSAWSQSPVDANEYVERRRRLVERVRQAAPKESAQRPLLIVARSAKEQFSAPDVPYPFRQCSYFRYLTGLPLANVVLTILAQPNDELVSTLYFDGRSANEELWQGPAMTTPEITTISGIDEVKRHTYLQTDLETQIPHAVVSFDLKQFPAKSEQLAEVLARFGGMVPLREQIDRLRWVKSKTEQQLMRATCDVGGRAMNAMIARSKGVRNENEIVGRLEMESRRRGAAWLAYPPVVAAANRANTIHYLDSSQEINEGDVVLVDAGCEVHGYVSDITRVFPAGGHFSSAQRALCDALNDLQSQLLRIVENVRPLRLNNLYVAMVEAMSKKLLEIGLFPSIISQQELIHETDKICPHHVSHYLGMDVHDTASVPRNISLVPGVTFTVEPGIYVRKDNKLAREDFRGIGMRIEDDVLVTDDGVEVLTRHCARESTDIEHLMKF